MNTSRDGAVEPVPGWQGTLQPVNFNELIKFLERQVICFRDLPSKDGYMRVDREGGGQGISWRIRKPNPRYVHARLQVARTAIANVHRWLDSNGMVIGLGWPQKSDDVEYWERELSNLLSALRSNQRRPTKTNAVTVEAPLNSNTFSMEQLKIETGLKNSQLTKYIKSAGVKCTRRGGKNRKFTREEVLAILNTIENGTGNRTTIETARNSRLRLEGGKDRSV